MDFALKFHGGHMGPRCVSPDASPRPRLLTQPMALDAGNSGANAFPDSSSITLQSP